MKNLINNGPIHQCRVQFRWNITRSKAGSKADQQIKGGCNFDAILNEALIHLITSNLYQNIIHKQDHKLDQKRYNRSKLDTF